MDSSPKRRRYKDNPYKLKIVNKIYFIELNGIDIEVSKEVYDTFNESELHDIKEMNEYDRHIYHYQEDGYLENLSNEDKLLEEIVEDNIEYDNIRKAINQLSFFEKKRIIDYFFYNKSTVQIANEEGVSQSTISKRINKSLIKLKKILKNWNS